MKEYFKNKTNRNELAIAMLFVIAGVMSICIAIITK